MITCLFLGLINLFTFKGDRKVIYFFYLKHPMSGVGLILRSNSKGRLACFFLMPGSHMWRNYLSHRRDNSIPGGSSTWDTVPTNEKIHHSEQQTTEMACNTATPSRLYWSYIAGSSPFTAI